MSRTGSEPGFSLLEVLVATVILSVGALFIFPSFFLATDALGIAKDRLTIQSWAEERLWEDARMLEQAGPGALVADAGEVRLGKRVYVWEKGAEEVEPGLFALTLTARWAAGGQARQETYAAWVAAPGTG